MDIGSLCRQGGAMPHNRRQSRKKCPDSVIWRVVNIRKPLHSSLTTGASSSRIDSGAGLNAKLATHATTKVIRLPKSTYHVHAILVAKKTYNIAAILASIPINAGGWLTLRKNVPTKNTPSTGPLISEAIESAWLNAEPAWWRAISATP